MPENVSTEPPGLDPHTVLFTPGALQHAALLGFTTRQLHLALARPRWVNRVRRGPTPRNQSAPRLRYCGHGVCVIVEGTHAIAVMHDDPTKGPLVPGERSRKLRTA